MRVVQTASLTGRGTMRVTDLGVPRDKIYYRDGSRSRVPFSSRCAFLMTFGQHICTRASREIRTVISLMSNDNTMGREVWEMLGGGTGSPVENNLTRLDGTGHLINLPCELGGVRFTVPLLADQIC